MGKKGRGIELTKYAASMKPRINRQATKPPKVVVPAVAPEIIPQTTMHAGRYRDGLPNLLRKRFEGTFPSVKTCASVDEDCQENGLGPLTLHEQISHKQDTH